MDRSRDMVDLLFTYGEVERIRRMLNSHPFTEIITSQPSCFGKDGTTSNLEKTLSDLCAVVQDVYQKIQETENEICGATRKLCSAITYAYDIEDLLDAAATEHLEQKVNGRHDDLFSIDKHKLQPPQSSDLFPLQSSDLFLQLSKLHDSLAVDLKSAIFFFSNYGRLSTLRKKKDALLLDTMKATLTSSYYDDRLWPWENTIVGRQSEKEEVIKSIFTPCKQVHPNILAIYGDPGIGKTTLANLVCTDVRVSTNFSLVLCTLPSRSITYPMSLKQLIVEIIQSATPRTWFHPRNLDMESLKDRLRGILQGQKYLLVLDNFYLNQHSSKWEELRELLEVGSMGSTVIMVNRWMEMMHGDPIGFRLEGLPENESWSLFTRYAAFDKEAEQQYPSLERTGRRIVKSCKGKPVAVKILGSTLHNNRDEDTWRQVIENKTLCQYNVVDFALRIGFRKMPYDLMQCFSGCIIIPDKAMSRDQVVCLWMAQGLLPSSDENEDLLDIGYKYFNELFLRGCFQLYQQGDYSPHHNTFQICHEAHRIARWMLAPYKHDAGFDFPGHLISRNAMFYSDQIPSDDKFPWNSLSKTKLRSFFFQKYVGPVTKPFLERLISALSYVRVLFLDHLEFEELPESISNLKLLRYLSLACNLTLQVIPDSISKLVNLQTLDLSGCVQLITLPTSVNLRHLLLSVKLTSFSPNAFGGSWMSLRLLQFCNCQNLQSLPDGIAQLTCLQVLRIHDCPSIASLPNAIKRLNKLEELSIISCEALDFTGWDGLNGLGALRFLQFQGIPKLRKFPEMIYYAGGDSLRHLIVKNCVNLRDLPACLHKCNNLLQLVIDGCPNIATLPRGIQQVKSLQVLKILNCPQLVRRCQHGRGQDWHLISHIPKIQILNQNRDAPDSVPSSSALHSSDKSGSETEGKDRELISLSPEGIDEQEVDIGKVHSPNMDLSSPEELQHPGVEMDCPLDLIGQNQMKAEDQGNKFTLPPPPPPFPQKSGPLSACRPRSTGFNSQGDKELGDHKQETNVEKEAAGNEITEFDQLPDLIVPSNELGKGILFLLGESYEFEKEKLIQLWMAAGFLKDEPLELNGAAYIEKLLSEGYVQLSDSNSLYKVNAEKVNSDLCMIQDKSKYLILETTSQQIAEPEDILHVSVASDDINDAIFKTLDKFKDLRTLLFHGSCDSKPEQVLDLFLGFKSLSILDLSGTDTKELPSSVGKMVHLKYLDLSWTLVEFLPESMSRLQRLQTLKLKGCSRLRRLPRDMKMLTELRHLDFNILGQLTAMPKGLGALVKLRTLSAFLVGTQEGFSIKELRELNNLTDEFCIARLENVKSADDAKWASITTKNRLKKLELRWSDFPLRDLKNEVEDDSVLKNLRPHSDLEELQIRCYAGRTLPSWIANESFHKLARITLFKCEHAFMLPSMQKLPSLEYLELISLNSLVKLDFRGETEIGPVAFPRLQKLIIDEMLILESWTQAEEGDFPCLVELTIKDCPKLSELPSLVNLSSMRRLELSSCPQVQLLPDKRLSTSLEFLIVEDCPFIKEWEMIKHVPNVWIDQEAIFEEIDDDSDVLDADDDSDYDVETEDDDGTEDDIENGWI